MATYDLTNLSAFITPGTFLEGIQSTGAQCINTGYKPNQNTRLVLDVTLNNQGASPRGIFGGRDPKGSSGNSFVMWAISKNGFKDDYNTTTTDIHIVPDGRFLIDKNKNITTINSTSITNTAETFQSNYELVIFSVNNVGGIDTRFSKGIIHSYQIYENDILLQDCKAYCNTDGTIGMLDVLNNIFYESATSTAFTGIPKISFKSGDIINCPYSGNYQSIRLRKGIYKLEVWGAEGGYRSSTSYSGKGGYSVGTISLEKSTDMYLYAGGSGNSRTTASSSIYPGGFNGGGYRYGYKGGGGASDIRINSVSLYARVIVAGGGGSDGASFKKGMYGGGTSGGATTENFGSYGYGGSQTGFTTSVTALSSQPTENSATNYPGGFGFGGFGIYRSSGYGGAGGGGWYGGCGSCPDGSGDDDRGGGGGSGYIYTSSTASNYPTGCLLNSSYYLSNSSTTAGNSSFISPTGSSETGHSGNGYVRITVIDTGYVITYDSNGGTSAPEEGAKDAGVDFILSTILPVKNAISATLNANLYNKTTLIKILTGDSVESFTFSHWNTSIDGSGITYLPGEIYSIDADLTLYAQYISSFSAATITFPDQANYSEEITKEIKLINNHQFYSELSTIYSANYIFENWNTKEDGTGDSFAAGNSIYITGNTAFYAQFLISHDEYTPIILPELTQTNKVFEGWYSPRNNELYSSGTYTPINTSFLYARWTDLYSNGKYDLYIYDNINQNFIEYEGYIYDNNNWKTLKSYIYPWSEEGNTWNDVNIITWDAANTKTWIKLREESL